jgi:hypothetical protein
MELMCDANRSIVKMCPARVARLSANVRRAGAAESRIANAGAFERIWSYGKQARACCCATQTGAVDGSVGQGDIQGALRRLVATDHVPDPMWAGESGEVLSEKPHPVGISNTNTVRTRVGAAAGGSAWARKEP